MRSEYIEYGATHITGVECLGHARDILVQRGVYFYQVYHHPIKTRRYYTDGYDVEDGLHYYFSDDDGNIVAYWTRIMNHLSINEMGKKVTVSKEWMWNTARACIASNPCPKENDTISNGY